MSCIKFPSANNELSKMPNKECAIEHAVLYSKLIAAANEIFGLDNWSHAIANQTLDYTDYIAGKYQVGCASTVRVQRRDGIFHEAIGYCNVEGSSKGSAIQKSRMISLNDAFKKALICFGSEITIKINALSSGPVCPVVQTNSQNVSLNDKANTVTTANNIDVDKFKQTAPISQTDVMMDMVDLEQLCNKDKDTEAVVCSKNVKTDTLKPCTGAAAPKNLDTSSVNKVETEAAIALSEANKSIADAQVVNAKDSKLNVTNDLKKQAKVDVSKTSGLIAVSDEEMRLERKRKQRELQEEFKRKEELKKKIKNTYKQPLNPRY